MTKKETLKNDKIKKMASLLSLILMSQFKEDYNSLGSKGNEEKFLYNVDYRKIPPIICFPDPNDEICGGKYTPYIK